MPHGARVLFTLVGGAACFGFAIGSSHSWRFAWHSAIKVPTLLLFTACVCSVGYSVTARFLAAPLRFGEVQALCATTFRDLAVLTASLSPPTFFLARTIVRPDDRDLGEYQLLLGVSMLFVAASGCLALAVQSRRLLQRCGLSRPRARAIVVSWLALSLLVGGQAAFCLRPLFGITAPETDVPFVLMNEVTVTGAHNFFEVVYQLFVPPELEPGYRRGR